MLEKPTLEGISTPDGLLIYLNSLYEAVKNCIPLKTPPPIEKPEPKKTTIRKGKIK